jgi:NAD(P)H-nitrite reductase large subunit
MAAVAALPDDAENSGCNGACKSKITGGIIQKELISLDDGLANLTA